MASRTEELMGALQAAPVARPTALKKRASIAVAKPTGKGKPFNIYMHPEDSEKLRELALYLGMQTSQRVSDSQVVKAALLAAHQNGVLVDAFREVASRDQRFKKIAE